MKIAGWILIGIAGFDFAAGIFGMAIGEPAAGNAFSGALLFGVFGAFLVHTGKRKEKEKQEHDAWEKE